MGASDSLVDAPRDHTGSVVVGVDGSPGAETALRWAVDHASTYGPVVPVHVWDYPAWTYAPAALGGGVAPSRQEMQDATRAGVGAYVSDLEPGLGDELVVRWGSPSSVLVEESSTAEMLVVGTRGHGVIASRLLGSVSLWCVHHATVPVAVVPDGALGLDGEPRVGVGVDGSPHSEKALDWALRHHAPDRVTVYGAWQSTLVLGYEQIVFDPAAIDKAAAERVGEAVERVCAARGVDPSDLRTEMSREAPGHALQDASDKSDLLVVGSRSRTGMEYAVFGSITTGVVIKPHCVTVVIPGDDAE